MANKINVKNLGITFCHFIKTPSISRWFTFLSPNRNFGFNWAFVIVWASGNRAWWRAIVLLQWARITQFRGTIHIAHAQVTILFLWLVTVQQNSRTFLGLFYRFILCRRRFTVTFLIPFLGFFKPTFLFRLFRFWFRFFLLRMRSAMMETPHVNSSKHKDCWSHSHEHKSDDVSMASNRKKHVFFYILEHLLHIMQSFFNVVFKFM